MKAKNTLMTFTVLCALAAVLVFSMPVGNATWAAGPSDYNHDHDHERARQALEAGQIQPLRAILDRVEREHPGQVMEVELENEDGRWIYEVKLLQKDGALVKLKLDARDGTLLGKKEKRRKRQAPSQPPAVEKR